MKKIILTFLLLVSVLCIVSCKSEKKAESNTKKEYTMPEFEKILLSVSKAYAKETEYLTDDEINEKKSTIYDKILKKYNLKSNAEITLRGKICVFDGTELYLTSTDNLNAYKDDDDKFSFEKMIELNNTSDSSWAFVTSGDAVVVRGKFNIESLDNCKLLSPTNPKNFKNNIKYLCTDFDSLSSDYTPLVYGVVKNIISVSEAGKEFNKDKTFSEQLKSSKYILTLTDNKNKYTMYYFCSNPNIKEAKVGDKLCARTFISGPLKFGKYEGQVFAYDLDHSNYYIY
ncbi:MAG: hypothetical protein KHW49_02745 [Eubacterium sp.]|nr:hypothetical protein [Eubacterium sp.]